MGTFQIASDFQRLDYRLLQNGSISLFFNNDILNDTKRILAENDYSIIEMDCSKWHASDILFNDFSKTFAFPDYFGQNLDALNDCLSDIEIPYNGGLAIVLNKVDSFSRLDPDTFWHVLDIIENNSRLFLLQGKLLLTLLQSNDPKIEIEKIGGYKIMWNPKEFFDKSRGL